ncbi:MAG: diaminopimelate decarboxylase [Clostridia bacterium]|nr:diaminopimelate decarboxylase [Clostridia bacterium]
MNERDTLCVNQNGQLEIGGITLKKLSEDFGTPLYCMDQTYIENMCAIYDKTLKTEYGDGLICYASKAFSCKEIYRIVNCCGIGADVVSGGELYTALSVGFPAEKICFHGNNKLENELELAVKNNVKYIVLDSYTEADDLDRICQKYNKIQDVLIRVNPGVEAHTHHFVQTATVDSKFGFSISSGEAEQMVLSAKNKKNLNLVGLHCHIGSQIFENKSFSLGAEKMTDFYKLLKDKHSIEFDVLNLGGGFGIYYSNDDSKKTCEEYADYIKNIAQTLNTAIQKKGLKKPFLILEPGRSIVGEAGVTLYTAGRIKTIKDVKNYIAVDGGMFDNPRFALYQAKYTVVVPEKMNVKPSVKYSIAGKCCESGDLIAEDCYLPEIVEGDLIAVLSTGAYNYSMSSNYNRNLVPPVVMIKDGKAKIVVKKQSYDDIIRNDV